MQKRKLASIEIPNNPLYVMPTLHFMDSIAAGHTGMDVSRYHQLRFVAGEILEKRMKRAYPGAKGLLTVELYLADCYVEFSVRDKGVPGWIDSAVEEVGDSPEKTSFRKFVLDSFVDEYGMEKLGSDGQRIFLKKKIVNPIQFRAPEPYTETEALDTNISIRPVLTEQDAVEAIRCIYSEYGYSYSYERLYYVDSFMRMVKSGELMSFLAVNDHGQTAGHFALVQSELYPGMPEVSTVIVRKEFRGLGLFAKFMDYSEAYAKEHGFRALMGQPVTFHPMSQKAFLRAGYTATALLMSYLGSSIESEYNQNVERLGLSAAVRIIDKEATSTIYPPEELKPFLKQIYDRLGWQYACKENGKISNNTAAMIENSEQLQMTRIILTESAEDLEGTLREAVKNTIKKKNEMIELLILLNHPSCPYAYETAKSCGFLLSGVIPGGGKGDYLVMQMLPGDDLKYDNLVTVGEFEELKENIASFAEKSKEVLK